MILLLATAFCVLWFFTTKKQLSLVSVVFLLLGCFVLTLSNIVFLLLLISVLLYIHPDK
jgi:hypothetical protein